MQFQEGRKSHSYLESELNFPLTFAAYRNLCSRGKRPLAVNAETDDMESTYNYQVLPDGGMAAAPNPGGGVYPGANAWTGITQHVFSNGTKIIKVWVHDARIVIRFSFDGVTWGDDIVLKDSPQAENFYHSALRCQVINYTNALIATYQIMGQW